MKIGTQSSKICQRQRYFCYFRFLSDNNDSKYKDWQIRLSDVLMYIPNPGQNYVPDNMTMDFPKKDENRGKSVKYKIIQNTSLQNVLELRSYTDFLGLFADSPNGIVQLGAQAEFFVAPSGIGYFYLFKKLTPYFNFAKFEEDSSYIYNIGEEVLPLEVLKKSYLDMGFKLNALSFSPTKEYPFTANLYGVVRYQIANMTFEENTETLKTIGTGAGIKLEFKRFNNFGLNFSTEFTYYNFKDVNDLDTSMRPENSWIFRNEAEIYYLASSSKSQAVFLRFRTFSNSEKGQDGSFYQLQFGYRFSIGVNKLKR